MTKPEQAIPLPPVLETDEGQPRRIGVELEMAGLDVDRVSEIVAEHIGGRVRRVSYYQNAVEGDAAGEWTVELDAAVLKFFGRREGSGNAGVKDISSAAENLIRAGAEILVPVEIASPPLAMDRLASVQELVVRLREAGAKGTTESPFYAFGMQFNPETPSKDAATITRYLKAFFCLYDWLEERADVDFTRRLTPYIDSFPMPYIRKVVDPDYTPDIETLIDDYLHHNRTRNRPLDLLPLFTEIDERRVRTAVHDKRVKARPAFHYRLPNCEIDRPDWSIGIPWRDWIEVERLANDPERLDDICAAYSRFLRNPIRRYLTNWSKKVQQWLTPPTDR